ncbi:MAG TPA: C4-type zinc ribbon domain-containing protein [Pyrinomonadaceae bacterium]
MKAELEQLIALQNADTSIRRLQSEIDSIPQRRADIEKEFEQRAFDIRAIEMRRDDARQERTRLETELQEQRARLERAERNLMSSKNEHEYTAAIREADAARKQISQLETQTLEKMETLEQAERELKEREPEISNMQAEHDERMRAFEEQTRVQTEQLAVSREERARLIEVLPKQLSATYNRLVTRIRDGVALAEARNGSCSACFMALRPQVMAEVRRGEEIIVCENCNRILYYVHADSSQNKSRPAASAASEVAAS